VRLLAMVLLLPPSVSCSTTTAPDRSDEERELTRNRQRWVSAGMHDYEYDFRRSCYCLAEATEEVHIVVRNDAIVSVVRTRDGRPASTQLTVWPRIDELFADVQQRLAQGAERLDVQYDATYGYPRAVVADVVLMMADDEYALTAGNLRRLP
jgi:Family of unknown function (DUF6174)